jgi:hypothetical protein
MVLVHELDYYKMYTNHRQILCTTFRYCSLVRERVITTSVAPNIAPPRTNKKQPINQCQSGSVCVLGLLDADADPDLLVRRKDSDPAKNLNSNCFLASS